MLIGNAGAVVYRWIKPALDTKETINTLAEDIEALKKHEKNDLETLQHLQEMNRMQCQAMLCIINHMIDNNNIEAMKETRRDIQTMLGEA